MKIFAFATAVLLSVTSSVNSFISENTFFVETEDVVYCSIDANTVSMGEIVNFTDVSFSGENCAEIFVDLLKCEGFEPIYYGTTESDFYLSGISGLDTASIDIYENMGIFLEENDIEYSETVNVEGELSEFDITDYSGWVFLVNGDMPSVGMCDYIPQPGDEIRLAFSLYYGEDLEFAE